MENSRTFLKKLKIELTYDPEIPLQGINSKKNMIWKDTCTPVYSTVYNSQDMEVT